MSTAVAERPPAGRVSLSGLRRGIRQAPDRILLVGTEGVGKSTFAADAPFPAFIAAEDGIRHLDVESFEEPKTFEDVMSSIARLTNEPHDHKTVVLDTLDWIEPLVWRSVCLRAKPKPWTDSAGNPDIEAPGYGKGYTAALEDWRRLLASLDALRARRGMEVILLAHAAIKVFQNPAGPDYARYECKLNKGAAALVREWTDVNLFAVHEEVNTETDPKKRGKGVSTGRRVVHTVRTAAWDAKNRHNLPAELPLSYSDYAAARAAGIPADPEALYAEAVELVKAAGLGAGEEGALRLLTEGKADAPFLARQVDRLRTRVAQKVGAV